MNLNKKILAIAMATGVAFPAVSFADAYYYSTMQITDLNVYGLYNVDTNGDGSADDTMWLRPGSYGDGNDSDGGTIDTSKQAHFDSTSNAEYSAAVPVAKADSLTFAEHVPLSPLPDAAESFISVAAGVDPGENSYGQNGWPANGEYSRGDSQVVNQGGFVNAAGGLESAGEIFNLVSEGYLASTGLITSKSKIAFKGVLDMQDMGLDDPSGVLEENGHNDTNNDGVLDAGELQVVSWAGDLKLEFNYDTVIDLMVNGGSDTAQASIAMSFTAEDEDGNLKAGVFGTDLGRSKTITGTDTFNTTKSGFFTQTFTGFTGTTVEIDIDAALNTDGLADVEVPEPSALFLLGAGLLGLGTVRRRK